MDIFVPRATIREARQGDGEALVAMGHAFFAEAGYGDEFEFDENSFGESCFLLARAGLLLIVEQDSQVIGMAAVDIAPAFWNRKVLLAREVFWYLVPEHRKGAGRLVLPVLEAVAKSHGAVLMDVVAEEGKRSKALGRLYTAGSYSLAENVFRKRL